MSSPPTTAGPTASGMLSAANSSRTVLASGAPPDTNRSQAMPCLMRPSHSTRLTSGHRCGISPLPPACVLA